MIIDMLSPDELAKSGLDLLNLVWSIGMDISREFNEAGLNQWDSDGEATDEYWRKSQTALGNALALLQQAQEIGLKSKIADVSPYLLIRQEPREWPRRCDREDIPFSTFRMVDAADLIKVYNTVCPAPERMGEDIEAFFSEVRRERNTIIHVGSTGRPVEVAKLLLGVLRTNEILYSGARWTERRLAHLENDRISVAYSSDHVGYVLVHEFALAVKLMKPADVKRYFGLTKARRYLCPHCHYELLANTGETVPFAQLSPNTPSSTAVTCFVCGRQSIVVRRACVKDDCKSNVICAEVDSPPICLVCSVSQENSVYS